MTCEYLKRLDFQVTQDAESVIKAEQIMDFILIAKLEVSGLKYIYIFHYNQPKPSHCISDEMDTWQNVGVH